MKTETLPQAPFIRASKANRRQAAAAPQTSAPAPCRRWYGGCDPLRDFIACVGFLAKVMVATGLVLLIHHLS